MIREKVQRKILKLDLLQDALYNPLGRILPERLKELTDSMELVGMLHPITITPHNVIIDGHRRRAAAKILGWTEIECNVVDHSPEEIYASVNTTPRRMSGNDALGVWLKCPLAVTARTAQAFLEMSKRIGKPTVERIYGDGYSIRVYRTAIRIARYCDDVTDATIKEVVLWLLEFPVIGQVMKALEAGLSPKKIMQAVRAKKNIVLSLEVA